jgi:hypothetical protein
VNIAVGKYFVVDTAIGKSYIVDTVSGNIVLWIQLLRNIHFGLCKSDKTPVARSTKIDVTVFLEHTSSYTIHDVKHALH